MTRELRLSPEARADLHEIWTYSRQTWGDERAEGYMADLRAMMEGLLNGSRRSHAVDHIEAGYRRATSGRHAIYFRQSEITVDVIRILHDRMDATGRLRKSRPTP